MRFTFKSGKEEKVVVLAKTETLIGRGDYGYQPDLNVAHDETVSRRHACVHELGGKFVLEDLKSTSGTRLNGKKIATITPLQSGDRIQVGFTTILFIDDSDSDQQAVGRGELQAIEYLPVGIGEEHATANSTHDGGNIDPDVYISEYIQASERLSPSLENESTEMLERLSKLYDLPLQFAEVDAVEDLYKLIIQKVVELIPDAQRGALLVLDPASNKLALRASIPEDDPPISRTLVKRAVNNAGGFIWRREEETDLPQSIKSLNMQAGMYAPLMWKGHIQGVVSVDSPNSFSGFTEKDLKFLLSVAHYAASAVVNHQLQKDLTEKATVLERLLTNFSPSLRGKLVDKALHGDLKPGGEKSDVTLLMSDIRGFSKITMGMDSAMVVEMLNEYFSALVDVIFEHKGTIDKFIGDAILAIFGSPEPDKNQQENAVLAALAMQDAMARVNVQRRRRGAITCELGIGLHYGEVLHGFIGGENRLEFTVIGETVNWTARYCDGAKATETLISDALQPYVANLFQTEPKTIPTKHEGDFRAFSVLGPKGFPKDSEVDVSLKPEKG